MSEQEIADRIHRLAQEFNEVCAQAVNTGLRIEADIERLSFFTMGNESADMLTMRVRVSRPLVLSQSSHR